MICPGPAAAGACVASADLVSAYRLGLRVEADSGLALALVELPTQRPEGLIWAFGNLTAQPARAVGNGFDGLVSDRTERPAECQRQAASYITDTAGWKSSLISPAEPGLGGWPGRPS
jgi:hypothetical protein